MKESGEVEGVDVALLFPSPEGSTKAKSFQEVTEPSTSETPLTGAALRRQLASHPREYARLMGTNKKKYYISESGASSTSSSPSSSPSRSKESAGTTKETIAPEPAKTKVKAKDTMAKTAAKTAAKTTPKTTTKTTPKTTPKTATKTTSKAAPKATSKETTSKETPLLTQDKAKRVTSESTKKGKQPSRTKDLFTIASSSEGSDDEEYDVLSDSEPEEESVVKIDASTVGEIKMLKRQYLRGTFNLCFHPSLILPILLPHLKQNFNLL